jgi:hypothetical protein
LSGPVDDGSSALPAALDDLGQVWRMLSSYSVPSEIASPVGACCALPELASCAAGKRERRAVSGEFIRWWRVVLLVVAPKMPARQRAVV